jgi:UDPglucose--hexose-1-phosphate uridylyltransferase
MSVSFVKETHEASFHDPREDFDRVTVPIELREDPLAGRQCRIVPAGCPAPTPRRSPTM